MRSQDEVRDPADPPAPSAREVRTSRLLVGAQFVLLALLVLLPSGAHWRVPGWLVALAAAAGLGGLVVIALAAAALGPGLTPSPLPNARAQLKTDGVYGLVRHPIYSGLLLVAGAVAAVSGSVVRLAIVAALVVLLQFKARWEERRLAMRFPDYPAYAARTPRFVPRLARRRRA
jgi:protein-S-isoprenylcysteine O-methyltransferase Ste14